MPSCLPHHLPPSGGLYPLVSCLQSSKSHVLFCFFFHFELSSFHNSLLVVVTLEHVEPENSPVWADSSDVVFVLVSGGQVCEFFHVENIIHNKDMLTLAVSM